MTFQGALTDLMKVFIGFYLACCMIGRPDMPLKLVTELRTKALAGTSASWGCPGVFGGNACKEYDPKRYK